MMAGGTSTASHVSLLELVLNTTRVKSGHSADRSGGSDRGSRSSPVPDGCSLRYSRESAKIRTYAHMSSLGKGPKGTGILSVHFGPEFPSLLPSMSRL